MSAESQREIYFSLFMFTADLRPEDPHYTKVLVKHMRKVAEMGYAGFDLHIATRPASVKHEREVESYRALKRAFDEAGFARMKFTTNVGTTPFYDPTSPYAEQRKLALEYLKSRVEITEVLGGEAGESIMSGPFLYPYGAYPLSDEGEPLWSDALQDWMASRYRAARSIFQELAEYAVKKGVKLALEPVKNWETPPPNMVSEALDFLETLGHVPCGITIDTAQVLIESLGPEIFRKNVARAADQDRLIYVHISPPDRGAVHDSWIPWELMLGELEPVFRGPYLIEIFNAIPPFDASMRMSRRRFWRPGEDNAGPDKLNAYYIASEALHELRRQIARVRSASCPSAHATPEGHQSAPRPESVPHKITFGMKLPPSGPVPSSSVQTSAKPLPPPAKPAPIVIAKLYGAVRIHTFIASYAENNIANATHIIESANALVVVDGQFVSGDAKQFRAYADDLRKPIERVYLSHRHPDHWFGFGTAFRDKEKELYALKETQEFVREHGKDSLADHPDAPKTVVIPQHEVEPGAETIDGVKYVFEEERNAEVEAQLTIKLPELGVAIVQDLIYSGTHLYLTKEFGHWRHILQKLLLSDYATFLPGHGRPADKNEVAANMEYLAAAQQAFDGGLTKVEFQTFLVQRYPGRLCPGIFATYLPRLFDGASEY
jgi:sugar phosphate isomerase/epimerase/glyoxylase-like metal-dependent hydrolase (beta-lactamase superfamily II)